ncbi:putative rmpB [Proteus mirabilis]|nr:putative rmpB [Proteus mirabilis]
MAWSGSTTALKWRQAGTDEYDEKRRQAFADTFYSWYQLCRQGYRE